MSILDLPGRLAGLEPAARAAVDRLLEVSVGSGRLAFDESLRPRLEAWFGGPEAADRARLQTVVRVRNPTVCEETLFNPLRALKPVQAHRPADDLEQRIEQARVGCDFCAAGERTTMDTWGRIESARSLTAANIARYDAHHGLVIFTEHHPHRFDAADVRDYLAVALGWLERTRADDPQLRFPLVAWNCLEAAGASQVHGHLHVLLNRTAPYGRQAWLERAVSGYSAATGRDYWTDWLAAHRALDLVLDDPPLTLAASLTPLKEKEVVIVAPDAGPHLADAISRVLRAFIDRLGVRAFNCAVYLPPLDSAPGTGRVIARLLDRGNPGRTGGGVGSMEMYGAPIVSSDPFAVVAAIAGATSLKIDRRPADSSI